MRLLLALCFLAVAGCTTLPGANEMSPAQLKAFASDKSSTAYCIQVVSAGGTLKGVFVNEDQAKNLSGTITITPDCAVTMTGGQKP